MTTTKPTTTPAPPSTAPTAQPLLDLSRVVLAIRRRRRLWVCMALIGLLSGLSVAFLLPTPPTAVTRIYVVHEDDQPSDTGNLARTDVTLMTTTKIAGAALEEVGSNQRPEDFLKEYTVTPLTNNVIEVAVEAKTNAEAVRRAQALADAFIAEHVGRVQTAAEAEAQALLNQRDRVQAELKQVNNQIGTAEARAREQAEENGVGGEQAANQPNAPGLDSLYARRAELTSRISDLSQQAEEAGIGAPRVAAGTDIVDAPRPLKESLVTTLATNAAIGLLVGLVLGWVLAALTGVVKDKPVLRSDIASNLGASVIAQLPAPRRGLARLWRAKRKTKARKRVTGTLVRLVREGSGPVSVLEIGSRRIAAALALDLAGELAANRDVVIIEDPAGRVVADDLPGRDLGELTHRAVRPIRIIGAEDTSPPRPGELRIGVGSVSPGTAWTDLRHLGTETLLVVRTAYANTLWLHTVARQLADSRIPIIGIVLVDPDPRDRSDGTLWDSLHTALRGRAHLPFRPASAFSQPPAKPKPYSARRPEWAPEPVVRPVPADAEQESTSDVPATGPAPSREPVAAPEPVPAGGVNGTRNDPELTTRRFAPIQPRPLNGMSEADTADGGEHTVHDLPTKRFAPVRQDIDELVHRRTTS
ncbi:MAG: Wzz/FepE/Etk N-terminal domain-containing protein [Actinophytocola sp.]|uniref:Wzz/FepE/Etk N-terminal domain-containing protein n=1 Tax=Actinophytocola sp. TaxID=1872138 RepID=UPI003D6A9866